MYGEVLTNTRDERTTIVVVTGDAEMEDESSESEDVIAVMSGEQLDDDEERDV